MLSALLIGRFSRVCHLHDLSLLGSLLDFYFFLLAVIFDIDRWFFTASAVLERVHLVSDCSRLASFCVGCAPLCDNGLIALVAAPQNPRA